MAARTSERNLDLRDFVARFPRASESNMKPISQHEAFQLLERWRSNASNVRIRLGASDGAIEDGMIRDVKSSPGQIVVAIWLLVRGYEKHLVLANCDFFVSADEDLKVAFRDGVRVLWIKGDDTERTPVA